MENIIPFIVVAISIIYSIATSGNKNKKKPSQRPMPKAAPQPRRQQGFPSPNANPQGAPANPPVQPTQRPAPPRQQKRSTSLEDIFKEVLERSQQPQAPQAPRPVARRPIAAKPVDLKPVRTPIQQQPAGTAYETKSSAAYDSKKPSGKAPTNYEIADIMSSAEKKKINPFVFNAKQAIIGQIILNRKY